MKRFIDAVKRFFLPPADAKIFTRIVPLFAVAFMMLFLFVASTYAWEETNSVSFCGLTCHTMPPEYVTHSFSNHTNVLCEDCHMGRDRLHVLIPRKVKYSWMTGTAMITNHYEFPIIAKDMAPAREACENCHKPEVFSSDKLVEIKNFADDEFNSPTSTYLAMKTGGGSKREGLGYGIHWHVENPVYFYATDKLQQNIPYIVVENADGTRTEYFDVETSFNPDSINPKDLRKMDCISCHNRTAHLVTSPADTVDSLLKRGLVSSSIPEIRRRAVEVMAAGYQTENEALEAINALGNYYRTQRADYYTANGSLVDQAVEALKDSYKRTHFPAQKIDWQSHPNNLEHMDSPGCFRCHDGKHLTRENVAVRLECNLCHSIPVVSQPNTLTAVLELTKGFEPPSHKNPNWITLHRDIFDQTCAGCHTVEDPGGSSNTSFCSNSACHGVRYTFAGFDAPMLRIALSEQLKALAPTPAPPGQTSAPAEAPALPSGPVTYTSLSGILQNRCGSCHGAAAMKGLNVSTYAKLMEGGESGPSVIPGEPENSLLVTIMTAPQKHFGQFTQAELELVSQWIAAGAPE